MDASLNAMGSPSKALVTFTDVVKDAKDGQEYTEAKMNGFPEAATGDRFEGDEYQFLIVASKFQTGFDQPKLLNDGIPRYSIFVFDIFGIPWNITCK